MSIIKLNRPMVFFDTETTGLDVTKDLIIEISTLKIFPDNKKEVWTQLINPGIPIPSASTKIHGIKDEDVSGKPSFAEVGNQISKIFLDSDIGGYNVIAYDYPLLKNEFIRNSIELPFPQDLKIVDPQVIYKKNERRDLTSALKFYCDKTLEDAHSAEADTIASFQVFEEQIKKYSLSHNIEELHNYCIIENKKPHFILNENDEYIFNFGKNSGKKAIGEKNYLRWMMSGEFPEETKNICKKILDEE